MMVPVAVAVILLLAVIGAGATADVDCVTTLGVEGYYPYHWHCFCPPALSSSFSNICHYVLRL